MIVYGRNPVREALRGRRRVQRVWATAGAAQEEWLAALGPPPAGRAEAERRAGGDLERVNRAAGEPPGAVRLGRVDAAEIERLCGSAEHQGVCADAGPYPYADARTLLSSDDALVIALDEIQDPHNLGAVCRVAESAGAAGVVIPERRSAEVTPAVCKASAGAVEHLAVARVPNLANWLAWAKDAGAWVYGAAASGGEAVPSGGGSPPRAGAAPVPYDQPDYGGKAVLVLGSEGRGLRPRVVTACDALVTLPQRGRVGSLNVSTAAAALVYGILHFRAGG